MRKGIGVSPGVAVGTAYCIHEIFVNPNTRRLADAEVLPELARYEKARDATAADLRALHAKVSSQVGPQQGAIFLAHEADFARSGLHRENSPADCRRTPIGPGSAAQCAERLQQSVRPDEGRVHQRAIGRCARRGGATERAFIGSAQPRSAARRQSR